MATARGSRKAPLNVVEKDTSEVSNVELSSDDTIERIRSGQTRIARAPQSESVRRLATAMAEKVGEAHGLSGEESKDLAAKILSGKIEDVRPNEVKDRKIYAELLADYNEECAKIGHGFDEFRKYIASEQKLIDDASALVKECEDAYEGAKNDWYIIPGNKGRAIQKAETALTAAKAGIAQATEQANIARTKRHLNASFAELFGHFEKRGAEIDAALEKSADATSVSYDTVKVEKVNAFKQKVEAAKLIEELKPKIEDAVREVQQEESIRDGLEVGSPPRAESEQKVSDLRRKVEELSGSKDRALVLFQNKERAAIHLEIQEQALLGELNAHEIAIVNHRANREHWRVTFQARMDIMKSAAGIEAHQRSDDVGAAITQKNAVAVAETYVAVMDSIVGTVEKHTTRRKELAEVRNIQRKGIEQMLDRLTEAHRKTMELGDAEDAPSYRNVESGGNS